MGALIPKFQTGYSIIKKETAGSNYPYWEDAPTIGPSTSTLSGVAPNKELTKITEIEIPKHSKSDKVILSRAFSSYITNLIK